MSHKEEVRSHVKALVNRIQDQVPFDQVQVLSHQISVYFKITVSSRKEPLCYVLADTGAVYMPAPGGKAWRAGAKGGVRYDLMDDESRELCFELAEPSGSFLCNNTNPKSLVG